MGIYHFRWPWLNCRMWHPFHWKLFLKSTVSRVNWRRIYSSWTYSRGCFIGFYVSSQSFCVLHQLCTKLGHMISNHCFPGVCFYLYNVYCHYVTFFFLLLFYILYFFKLKIMLLSSVEGYIILTDKVINYNYYVICINIILSIWTIWILS